MRISVRDITPVKRPDILAPGKAAAETAEPGKRLLIDGDAGVDPSAGDAGSCGIAGVGGRTAWAIDGVARGVAGVDDEGEADSTTHIR